MLIILIVVFGFIINIFSKNNSDYLDDSSDIPEPKNEMRYKKLETMSKSKCIKCDSTEFETYSQPISDYRYEVTFIRCSSCKAVVGTVESEHIPSLIRQLATKLDITLTVD